VRGVLLGVSILLCGFVPPKLDRRTSVVVRISDAGQLYSTINTIDCLAWPSEEIKREAGMGGWGKWYPANGDVGVPIGRSVHCFQKDVMVVMVRIGDHIAPVGTKGLTFERGNVEDVPLFTRPPS
jgi:hypothetical protein